MRATTLALACLFAVLLLASGCGGEGAADSGKTPEASPSPQHSLSSQLKTYANEEWHFSLQYPATWSQGDPPLSRADFATAFANVAKLGEMTEAERESARALWISVKRMPEPGTESDFRTFLEGMAAEAEGMAAEAPGTGDPSMQVTQTEMGEFAGLPCLIIESDLTIDYFGGSVWHQRAYLFGQDDLLYTCSLYGVKDRWQQDEAELEAMAQSFAVNE